jgi:hypothetical protein
LKWKPRNDFEQGLDENDPMVPGEPVLVATIALPRRSVAKAGRAPEDINVALAASSEL